MAGPPRFIRTVSIEQLFGRYTYPNISRQPTPDGARLMFLYGDNGCGKTTLLRLIFHVLSPAQGRGHKSFIARTPFQSLTITLSDNARVHVSRRYGELIGAFTAQLFNGDALISQAHYATRKSERSGELIVSKSDETQEQIAFEAQIQKVLPVVFFLGDDRELVSDALADDENRWITVRNGVVHALRTTVRDEVEAQRDKVAAAIERAERWMRQQVFQGTRAGDQQVQSVYRDIVERISRYGVNADAEQLTVEQLLGAVESRSAQFATFGLLERIRADEIIAPFNASATNTRSTLQQIIASYADSLNARMNALSEAQKLFELFVTTVNRFLVHKRLELHVRRGLNILTESHEVLTPAMLSSGERHLLLLLCSTMAAREQSTIFIIDEPEISLNVKWQRALIEALLLLTQGSDIQFVLATHSIQLLAQYQDYVVKMEPS